MDDIIYCVIDASASMQQQNKYQLCLDAALSLAKAKQLASQNKNSLLITSKIVCLVLKQEVIPIKNFDGQVVGSSSISALQTWLEQKTYQGNACKVLFFTDGCFYDNDSMAAFKGWSASQTNLKLVVIGIGADQNTDCLKQLAFNDKFFKLDEMSSALVTLESKPLPLITGVAVEIQRRKSAVAEDFDDAADDEDDEWE